MSSVVLWRDRAGHYCIWNIGFTVPTDNYIAWCGHWYHCLWRFHSTVNSSCPHCCSGNSSQLFQ